MSLLYTPNPANNPAQITIPTDGDAPDAASVQVPLEALADKDARKLDKLSGGTVTGFVAVASPGAIDIQSGASLTVEAGAIEIHNNAETHNGAETHAGAETHTGTVTVSTGGQIVLAANADTPAIDARAQIKLTNQARITKRPPEEQSGTADIVRNASDNDCVAYLGLTADRTLTLTSGTGSPGGLAATVGDEILVTLVPLGATVHTVHVVNDALTGLVDLKNASGSTVWARFTYFATGGWRVVEFGNVA